MTMSRLHSLHLSTRQSDCLSAHHFPHRHRALPSPDGMPALGADDLASLGPEGAMLPVLGAVLWPAKALDGMLPGMTPDSPLSFALSGQWALG
jgi:hypothetical protein